MIRTVTFDCYGSLFGSDIGVLQAFADACAVSRQFDDQFALKSFDRADILSTSKPYHSYLESTGWLLAGVGGRAVAGLGRRVGPSGVCWGVWG